MVWLLAGFLGWGIAGCGPARAEPGRDVPSAGAEPSPPAGGPSNATQPDGAGVAPASGEAPASLPEWTAWRGGAGQGIVRRAELPEAWPGRLELAWQGELGTGWSSPVVAEGRVFVTDRIEGEERTVAWDLETGRRLWATAHPVDFDPHAVGRNHGNGPKATPVYHAGKVYSVGIAGWLECLEAASGRRLWAVNYPAEFGRAERLAGGRARVVGTEHVLVPIGDGQGAPVPLFGYTGSPALAEGKLICPVGGARGGTIQAFDAATGRLAWRALDENVSYSSPVIATLGGVNQVVAMTGPRVCGLELATGKLLWSHPFQIQYDESISTPVVSGDLVLVTGDGHPLTALAISRQGDEWRAGVAWENPDLSSYLSTMVVVGDHVYGMADDGRWAAIDLAEGKTRWQAGDHGYYATALAAQPQGVLWGLNERGELLALAADPARYLLRGQYQVADTATWTAPALVGRRVVVRSESRLGCWVWAP